MGTHPIFESDFDCLTEVMRSLWLFVVGVFCGKFDETESDYTIIVGGGKRDCYYESFKKDQKFEIEYQVVDGGDLDITFEVFDPKNKRIVSDVRQEDGLHNIDTEAGGDFQFCFDNRFSRMTEKTVFWEIFLDDDDYDYDDDYEDEDYKEFKDNLAKDDYEEDTLKGLTNSLNKIKGNHGKTLQFQAMLRAFEAKDRNVIEHNYERVNFWSMVHLVAMVATAVFQVFFLRSLFAQNTAHGQKQST